MIFVCVIACVRVYLVSFILSANKIVIFLRYCLGACDVIYDIYKPLGGGGYTAFSALTLHSTHHGRMPTMTY